MLGSVSNWIQNQNEIIKKLNTSGKKKGCIKNRWNKSKFYILFKSMFDTY